MAHGPLAREKRAREWTRKGKREREKEGERGKEGRREGEGEGGWDRERERTYVCAYACVCLCEGREREAHAVLKGSGGSVKCEIAFVRKVDSNTLACTTVGLIGDERKHTKLATLTECRLKLLLYVNSG